MTDIKGKRTYFLARGEQMIPVDVGVRLDEGFLVEAITGGEIHLRHPATDTKVTIPMPPPSLPLQ